MSIPANLRMGPHTSLILLKRRYITFHVFLIWISLFVVQFEFWWYWNFLYYSRIVQFIIFLPLVIMLMYVSMVVHIHLTIQRLLVPMMKVTMAVLMFLSRNLTAV